MGDGNVDIYDPMATIEDPEASQASSWAINRAFSSQLKIIRSRDKIRVD